MKTARNFRDYPVWQAAADFATKVYKITGDLPWFEKKGLCDQLQRAPSLSPLTSQKDPLVHPMLTLLTFWM